MKRAAIALFALSCVAGSAFAQQPELESGTWITIYMNDFKGLSFGSLTKNEVCVSKAEEKVAEFASFGLKVTPRVHMKDIAVFNVSGKDDFLVYCNQNGVLLVDILVAGQTSAAMAKNEAIGTETRTGDAPRGVTKTETDKETGKTTTTTTTPTQ